MSVATTSGTLHYPHNNKQTSSTGSLHTSASDISLRDKNRVAKSTVSATELRKRLSHLAIDVSPPSPPSTTKETSSAPLLDPRWNEEGSSLLNRRKNARHSAATESSTSSASGEFERQYAHFLKETSRIKQGARRFGPAPTKAPTVPLPQTPTDFGSTSDHTTSPAPPSASTSQSKVVKRTLSGGQKSAEQPSSDGFVPVHQQARGVDKEPGMLNDMSQDEAKSTMHQEYPQRPETSTSNATMTTDAESRQTWRISVLNEQKDGSASDQFAQLFGSPSFEQFAAQFSSTSPLSNTEDFGTPSQPSHQHVERNTPSAGAHRGPLLLNDQRPKEAYPSLSSKPKGKDKDATLPPRQSPARTQNASQREQKLARLRAQQQLLFLEQQSLEIQQQNSFDEFQKHSGDDKQGLSDDTEMAESYEHEPQSSVSQAWKSGDKGSVEASAAKRSRNPSTIVGGQTPHVDASEYELSALRAQVAQLQFALKRQMAGYSGANMPSIRKESTGLPTPEESFSGGSIMDDHVPRSPMHNVDGFRASSRSAGRFGAGGSQYGPPPASSTSFMDEIARHQYHHGAHLSNGKRYEGDRATFGGSASSRYAPSIAHHHQMPMHSEVQSIRSSEQSSRPFDAFSTAEELFANRTGDVRVDELAAKLDRLEELFRLTALNSSSTTTATARYDEHASLSQRHLPFSHEPQTISSRNSLHLSTPSSPYDSPVTLTAHPPAQRHGAHGPVRSTSVGSSISSVRGAGVSAGTRSPAASAYMFNATPYPRQHSGQGHAVAANAMMSTGHILMTPSSSREHDSHARSTNDPTSTNKAIAVPRKGVARFILGSTAKLADATDGSEVPSMQVSWSRKRNERVEKPKAKVKSAGRGRVVIVQKPTE